MKKIVILFVLLVVFSTTSIWAQCCGGGGGGGASAIVPYTTPKDDSEVDLTNKEYLTFKWKRCPIPNGGRRSYRFTLYKGFGYEVLHKEKLTPDITSINISRDRFENDALYTWHVRQRSAWPVEWSPEVRWSFKVKR